jgi:molecular chaperone GrpE
MTDTPTPEPDWDDALEQLVEELREAPTPPKASSDPASPTTEDLLAERTADLQRLQAEYVNYKKRVDRDRPLARAGGIEAVLTDLLPVLDGIEAARTHDELTGGAKLLADELTKVTQKYGLTAYGAAEDPFDPHIHEALMALDQPGYAVTTVTQVFQSGYQVGERILRPARVAVAHPTVEETPAPPAASDATAEGSATAASGTTADTDASAGDPAQGHASPTSPGSPATPPSESPASPPEAG